MKAISEILNNYEDYETPCNDRFGIRFCSFLTSEQVEEIGFYFEAEYANKHVPIEWTEENIIKQMTEDVQFGWEKACEKRAFLSYVMTEAVKAWCKVLGNEFQNFDVKTYYNQYGKPLFKAVAQKYNINLSRK